MHQWLSATPDQASTNQPLLFFFKCIFSPIRHRSSFLWKGLPVQLGSCPAGHSDEASAVNEAWCLPQTESVGETAAEETTQTNTNNTNCFSVSMWPVTVKLRLGLRVGLCNTVRVKSSI